MLRKLIREADNVMLLGHGSKNGLFSTVSKKNKYRFDRIIVDSQFVDDLRKKDKVICIFCMQETFLKNIN